MNFAYTIDHNAEEPIMLIDTHIGFDEQEGMGVSGAQFSRELLYLDTLNKRSIQVWINSPGGLVADGMQIFNTMLKIKTKVDTHNVGMAASIAGPIFLAGRKRCMMDNAVFMMHPVHGGDEASMEIFTDSIISMLSSRSIMSEKKTRELMNATTWLNAADCMNLGIATEIEESGDLNLARKISGEPKALFKDFANITNKILNKNQTISMKSIANKFNLNENANEAAILIEIEKLENKAKVSAEDLKKAKHDADEAKAKYDKFLDEYNTLKEKYDKLQDKVNKADKAENEVKIEALINGAVIAKKIANDAKVIEQYKALANKDYEGTANLIEALPASNKAASIITATKKVEPTNGMPVLDASNPDSYVAARAMLIQNKNNQKVK